jgi:hypothetical protein
MQPVTPRPDERVLGGWLGAAGNDSMGYAMVEARVMGFRVTRFTVKVMHGSKQYSRSFAYRQAKDMSLEIWKE